MKLRFLAPAIALAAAASAQPRATAFPIAVTIAQVDGHPVVDEAWLATELENASSIFEPHGVRFRFSEHHEMDDSHARIETRDDRHALGRLMHARAINVFVVESLRDVDDPTRFRQGVHWRPHARGVAAGAHLVIVSSIAGPTVLAHELGHFFGNPHSQVPGNIMSYDRGDVPPFFDRIQSRRIRDHAREFVESGEIVTRGSRHVRDVDVRAEGDRVLGAPLGVDGGAAPAPQ